MEISSKISVVLRNECGLQLEIVEIQNEVITSYRILLTRIDPFSALHEWSCNREQVMKMLNDVAILFVGAGNAVINDMRLPPYVT